MSAGTQSELPAVLQTIKWINLFSSVKMTVCTRVLRSHLCHTTPGPIKPCDFCRIIWRRTECWLKTFTMQCKPRCNRLWAHAQRTQQHFCTGLIYDFLLVQYSNRSWCSCGLKWISKVPLSPCDFADHGCMTGCMFLSWGLESLIQTTWINNETIHHRCWERILPWDNLFNESKMFWVSLAPSC